LGDEVIDPYLGTCSVHSVKLIISTSKKMKAGRLSKEKAPYKEMSRKDFAACKRSEHKRTICPKRGDMPKQPRKGS
jgi:hypothetical protein